MGEGLTVTAWFNFVHVLNPGASFSFLADAGGWQGHALTAVGLAVSVALAVYCGAVSAGDSKRLPTSA